MRQITLIFISVLLGLTACNNPSQLTKESLTNTIYKLGRKTDSTSTGPMNNSTFILKINDSLPTLLITAHHIAAGIGNDQYVKWNEIEQKKNMWAWSMNDSTYSFRVGPNLPIRGAETLKLDLAAFYLLADSIPYLKPARQAAHVGDTVYLYSKVTFNNKTTLRTQGVVIYATDSVMVYELTDFHGKVQGILSGTSGSCVLDKDNNVVANSYGGLAIPNEAAKKQMAMGFPLINKLNIKDGRTYGIGIPIPLIEQSLIQAFKEKN
jgi:hypothetical protein